MVFRAIILMEKTYGVPRDSFLIHCLFCSIAHLSYHRKAEPQQPPDVEASGAINPRGRIA